MEKGCLECGVELFGRVDKKFCCDQCRSTYYNKQHSLDNTVVRNINNVLRKNRKILAELISKDRTKIQREKLLEKAFNFTFFTNTLTTKEGRIYYYCYDFGYFELEDGWYALVKKLDWVGQ